MQIDANLDLSFIHRIYRTTLIVLAITTALIWEAFHLPAAVGWLLGAGLSLGVISSVEAGVTRFLRTGGEGAGGQLVGLYFLKMLGVIVAVVLMFVLRKNGMLSFRWLLAGFPLPAVVGVLKYAGLRLRSSQSRETGRADRGPIPPADSSPGTSGD